MHRLIKKFPHPGVQVYTRMLDSSTPESQLMAAAFHGTVGALRRGAKGSGKVPVDILLLHIQSHIHTVTLALTAKPLLLGYYA